MDFDIVYQNRNDASVLTVVSACRLSVSASNRLAINFFKRSVFQHAGLMSQEKISDGRDVVMQEVVDLRSAQDLGAIPTEPLTACRPGR